MAKPELHVPTLLTASVLAGSIGLAPCGATAAEHTLMPSPQTVHIGHFSAALKPVLTINSGDSITIETATQIDPESPFWFSLPDDVAASDTSNRSANSSACASRGSSVTNPLGSR